MSVGNNIKKRRESLNMSVEELASKIGKNRATIYRYENGDIESLPSTVLNPLSEALKTTLQDLMGWTLGLDIGTDTVNWKFNDFYRIPVYGSLCCGNGGFAEDNIDEYVNIPTKMLRSGKDYFANYASGDSMIGENINPGDLIIFEKTNYVDNGDIGCFCIDDNEAMCKKFKKDDRTNIIMLLPANDKYDPVVITLENDNFRCIGKLALVINDRQDD